MKSKQIIIFGLILISFTNNLSIVSAQTIDTSSTSPATQIVTFPYEKTFTITAYYSPVEGQARYIRGNLQGDKKLNGNGTNGADGTQVFPGMIAAPSSIAFGTKMKIPGIGTVSVHDRGGAIVKAGQRNQTYDRLDIWMGKGDQGLNRALQWGKRNVTVMVYGLDQNIQESIDLSHLDKNFKDFVSKPVEIIQAKIFTNDFGLGDSNDQILTLKQKLQQLNYLDNQIIANNQFDAKTYQAIIKFQIDYQIIDNDQDFGAGFFGPQTRKFFEKALNGLKPGISDLTASAKIIPIANAQLTDSNTNQILLAGNGLLFLQKDLQQGDSGEAVLQLQTELKKLHLFGIDPTGYYGEVTTNAVFKLQQNLQLVTDLNSTNAGIFNSTTRQKLSELVNTRIQTRQAIADNSAKAKLLAKK